MRLIDKNGGLPNTSTYIGFASSIKTGVVILSNRGRQKATAMGRRVLHELAHLVGEPPQDGADPD